MATNTTTSPTIGSNGQPINQITTGAQYNAAVNTPSIQSNLNTQVNSNSNTSPAIQTTPVNPTPNASDLGFVKPITLPPVTTPTSSNAAAGVIGIAAGTNSALQLQQKQLADEQAQRDAAQEQVKGNQQQVTDLLQQLSGKGQAQLDAENAAGIPQMQVDTAEKTAASNTLTNQYQTMQLAYNEQYQQIANNPNLTVEQRNSQINDLTQQHAFSLTDVAIRQSIMATEANNSQNLTATQQALVNHKIDIQYGNLKDLIGYQTQILSSNQGILTQKEQNLLTSQIAYNTQQYQEGVYQAHLFETTKIQNMQQAQANNAPKSVLDGIASATDFASIGEAGQGYLSTNVNIQQLGIDPSTGFPIYAKVSPNGVATPITLDGAVAAGTSGGSQSTVVNGYQFGKSDTLGAYASDTYTQVANIQKAVGTIQNKVGDITTPQQANQAIQALLPSGAKSPITGDMVMTAAQKYGVDPSVIIATAQAETQCGTDGSTGAKQCNWGNVGNTDSAMASGKSIPMTPQGGIDAIAQNLAMRDTNRNMQMQAASASQNPVKVGVDAAKALQQAAPQLIRNSVNYLNTTGDAYIDGSTLKTDTQSALAAAWSKQTGVPILKADDVADLKSINTALANLNQIETQFKELAPNGVFGKALNATTNSTSKAFGTDYGDKLSTYQDTTLPAALGALKIIAGSARLGQYTGDISNKSLPTLPNGSFTDALTLGLFTDTLNGGLSKIDSVKGQLNNALQSIIPNSNGAPLSSSKASAQNSAPAPTLTDANGTTLVQAADGLYYPKK